MNDIQENMSTDCENVTPFKWAACPEASPRGALENGPRCQDTVLSFLSNR